jgi:nucleoside-diphosphate-sugar epimerase
MKILITGSNGYLGRFLKMKLSQNNVVAGLSKSNSEYNFDLTKNAPIFSDTFDLVIHAAGKAHTIPKNDIQAKEFFDVNVLGTVNLLEGLKINLPKHFVFISSVAVYGLVMGENIDESSPLLASDPYGASKVEAEKIILNWCEQHNVVCTILRLPLLVGSNPPGNLGYMIKGIKKGYYFNIGGGNAKKSMVLLSDIAEFIIIAATYGGIFNLTDGENPSFKDLSKVISKNLNINYIPNLPNFIAIFFAKIGDVIGDNFPFNTKKLIKITSTLTFNDSKARKTFGWCPTPVLEEFIIIKDAQ